MNVTGFKYSMREVKAKVAELGLKIVKTNKRNFVAVADDAGNEFLISYRSLVAAKVGGQVMINDAYTRPYSKGDGLKACSPTTGTHFSEFGAFGALVNHAVPQADFVATIQNVAPVLARAYNVSGGF